MGRRPGAQICISSLVFEKNRALVRSRTLASRSFEKCTFTYRLLISPSATGSGARVGEGQISAARGWVGGLIEGREPLGTESLKSNCFFQSRLRCLLRRFKLAEVAQMLPLFKETVIKDRVDISLRSVTYFSFDQLSKKSRGSQDSPTSTTSSC